MVLLNSGIANWTTCNIFSALQITTQHNKIKFTRHCAAWPKYCISHLPSKYSNSTFQDSGVVTSGQQGLIIGAQTSDKC